MTERADAAGAGPDAAALGAAVRAAIALRGQWAMPVTVLRYGDSGEYEARPAPGLPAGERPFSVVAEFDRDELDDLASYTEADLDRYVAEVLCW
jgi:hypothetical protein